MNIIRLADFAGRAIHEHASAGAHVLHITGDSQFSSIVQIHLNPDGVLGMHEAEEDQLFIVIEGTGIVRSDRSEEVRVSKGDLVYWRSGELHETRSGPHGLSAIVVEGPDLGKTLRVK